MYPAENRQATSSKQKRDRRRIFASGFCGLFHRKSKSPASPSTTTPHAGTSAAGSQVQIDVKKPEATVKEAITESRELPHRKLPTYPESSLQVPGTIDLEAPESRRSSVSFAPTDGDKGNLLSWKKALEIATEKLADEERLELETDLASECTVISVLKAAEDARKDRDESKWRYTKKNGEVVILRERFDRIVEGFDKYARIIDVAIQHHPDVTSLVWASARFLLQVYLNHKETVEKLEAALKSIINSMANCEFYANIYTEALNVCFRTPSTSIAWVEKLESALPQFYAAILVFAVKAKRYFTPSTRGKFTNPLKPFATTLQTYLDNVDKTERAMKELAGMATMQGVKRLRYNTLNMVREMRDLFTEISDDKAKQWLNAVPPDPMYDFNKERRLEGTCEWIFKNESYNTWIHSNGNRDLWIVGIQGAGKSVLATNLLDKLRESEGTVVLFFFFRDGDNRTMSPLEMVASIIAQLIQSGIDQERLMRILKLRMESSSYFTNNANEPRDFKKLCATLIECHEHPGTCSWVRSQPQLDCGSLA
ncbi:hypothetical protein FPQ18DRAFT_332387 [Pyronema domesticum]|nr:hypothetical protein FPQ18DRAFT_332387 [Pyronema domesticum]